GLGSLGRFRDVVLAFVLAIILATLATLFFVTRPAFAQHAEIVIRILQIIFGLDAIALHLRVAGQALIFLEKLGGIAALPVVLAIAGTGIAAGRTTAAPAAAPAAALTIVDQT